MNWLTRVSMRVDIWWDRYCACY